MNIRIRKSHEANATEVYVGLTEPQRFRGFSATQLANQACISFQEIVMFTFFSKQFGNNTLDPEEPKE